MKIICFFTKVDQRCSYLNTSSGNIMNCFKPGYFSTYISWFIITHLLNLFNENQGMREIGWIFVQFGLESIPECSSDCVLDFLLYAVMGKKVIDEIFIIIFHTLKKTTLDTGEKDVFYNT